MSARLEPSERVRRVAVYLRPYLLARLERAARSDEASLSACAAAILDRALPPLPGFPVQRAKKGKAPRAR